ncbi:hypothetical protein [Chitinimonas taiwanensis]|jgi:hypothetical protein|uniref:hypothetical protein n=1 Tax=Chitinimonas taiwanensis TaxID=240412 RepID=UPI00160F7392
MFMLISGVVLLLLVLYVAYRYRPSRRERLIFAERGSREAALNRAASQTVQRYLAQEKRNESAY